MPPLPETLDRVADEIDDLADLGQSVQAVIAHLARGLTDPGLIADAQGADALCQRLEGLGRFVRVIAETAPDTPFDARRALAALTLGAQVQRLAGVAIPVAPASEDSLTLWD